MALSGLTIGQFCTLPYHSKLIYNFHTRIDFAGLAFVRPIQLVDLVNESRIYYGLIIGMKGFYHWATYQVTGLGLQVQDSFYCDRQNMAGWL